MIEDRFLHFLIDEEIFLIEKEEKSDPVVQGETKNPENEVKENPKKVEVEIPKSQTTKLLIALESINDAEREFLTKIMAAINLSDEEYKIVTTTKDIPNYPKALLFTKNPKFTLYEVYNFRKTELLTALSLGQLMESNEEKRKLWMALKKWFNIS
jgi:hypothetical protein